jgi:hypothetical protein
MSVYLEGLRDSKNFVVCLFSGRIKLCFKKGKFSWSRFSFKKS